MIGVCTSGKKHETLPMGVLEYADFKNSGNHDAEKFKMATTEPFFYSTIRLEVPRLP